MPRDKEIEILSAAWFPLVSKSSNDEALSEKLLAEIIAAYTEPHRRYHGISHIVALLRLSEENQHLLSEKEIVDFSIFLPRHRL